MLYRVEEKSVRRQSGGQIGALSAAVAIALLVWPVGAQQQPEAGLEMSSELVLQLEALMAEKAQRTPAQQKVSSDLLHAERIQRGEPITDDAVLRQSLVEIDPGDMVTVDIRADVTPEVLARIDALGGSVINSVPRYSAVRAQLPLAAVETLAELEAIQWIRPADQAVTRGQTGAMQAAARGVASDPAVTRKLNTSEGDVAHRADQARRQFGVDGSGIGIGVLSDGVDSLGALQASGDLPATVTVLPGQARPSQAVAGRTYDEGTAMLEIVHDLAPGADLYFATAFGGQAQFAANIEALCEAGADVIVDDIGYLAAGVFQDDIVARGVDAATAKGCIYFSAAGNDGNLNDRTSGVWEGDFVAESTGKFHLFTRTSITNRIADYDGTTFCVKWSDPLGASSNDYDLVLIHPFLTQVVYASTDTQTGTQDPVECIGLLVGTRTGRILDLTGYRIAIGTLTGASSRYLHLNMHGGRLQFGTTGATYGHAAAANAIGVAATDATRARGLGGVFNGTESVERFSSDGPRRMFFDRNGSAITPGNVSSSGGLLLQKPDVTAADRVSTATPEFETFPGTSAAAPHAAAIAALMLQAAGGPRSLTRAQLLKAMQDTALDIEAPGPWDRDSGAGIIDALAAVSGIGAPAVSVAFGQQAYSAREGGPPATITVQLSAVPGRALTIPLVATPDGGATAADYGVSATSVTFGANATEATVTVTAVDDQEEDAGERVILGFGTLPAGVTVGSPDTTAVSLEDNDTIGPTVSFGRSVYTATEGGSARVRVRLDKPLVPAQVTTISVTATPGGGAAPTDFRVPATVTIGPDLREAIVELVALADADADDGETVVLSLGSLPPGVAMGMPATTTVTLRDDETSLATDRMALEALYGATGGSTSWTDGTNWLTNAPLGDWYGVDTNEQGRVEELQLASNGLTGAIPTELGTLIHVWRLGMTGSALSGTIPPELAGLANLEELHLNGNELSGTIPPELAGLANLEELHLNGNELSGTIPPELAGLANLKELWLNSNTLSGTIPTELAVLGSLEELRLHSNNLNGSIPPELAQLANLDYLRLDGNDLSGTIPPELAQLINLQGLFLSENQLTGPIPPELAQLTNLLVLYLGGNELTLPLPVWLGNLTNLIGLGLWDLKVEGPLPAWLETLTNLQFLYLHDNPLTGLVSQNLTHLQLRSLWIHETRICVPAEPTFETWRDSINDFRGKTCGEDVTEEQYDRYRDTWQGLAGAGAPNPANAAAFTDHPIASGTILLKAAHFHELRARVASLRMREGLPAVQWTDSTIVAGVTPVKRVHLTELRSALDGVYDAMGRSRPSYTDVTVTAGVTAAKAVHIMELRAAVTTLE